MILLRKGKQVGCVSIEPAYAVSVDAADGPFDAAVELLKIWIIRQSRRKLDVLHQFVGALTLLHPLDRLIENGLDAISVRG